MSKKEQFKTLYALSFAWQLGFLIAAPLAIMIFLGLWVDRIFQSSPWFLLGGLVLAIITTIYEVYHLLSPLIHSAYKHD